MEENARFTFWITLWRPPTDPDFAPLLDHPLAATYRSGLRSAGTRCAPSGNPVGLSGATTG